MQRSESPDVVKWSACMRRDVQGVGTHQRSETGRSCTHRWCSLAGVGAHLRSETGRGTMEKWIWAGDDGKVFGKIHYI